VQANVDEILTAGKAITFEDRDGNDVEFDLVTARYFRETRKNRVLYVGGRHWERERAVNTTATSYDGYWVYPTFIYLDSKYGQHEDYTDFTEAENAAGALLMQLLGAEADWELGDDKYDEAQIGDREMIAAELEIKKFATRRF
jgi:hypothetical protein